MFMLMILVLAGCKTEVPPQKEEQQNPEPPLVGGDRDEHGCIGSAGYTWCEAKQNCLRVWEEECEPAVQ